MSIEDLLKSIGKILVQQRDLLIDIRDLLSGEEEEEAGLPQAEEPEKQGPKAVP